MRSALPLLAGIGCALVACSPGYSVDDDRGVGSETGLYDGDGDAEVRSDALVLNVFPGTTDAGTPLLPRSFTLQAGANSEVLLSPSIDWSGVVTGVQTAPWAAPELPGASGPISASVRVWKPGTVQDRHTSTNETTGQFALTLVPDNDYRVAIVPDSVDAPFLSMPADLFATESTNIELGSGTAVYGSVRFSTGAAIASASVYAVDDSGVAGPPALTDAQGNYQLRVTEGRHRVVSIGRDNGRDPTVRSAWVDVPSYGAAVDFTYAPLSLVTVGGRIVNEFGDATENVTVRLRSVALDGFNADATHQQEVRTNAQGIFDTRVVPGVWEVDVLGEQGQAFSPVALGELEVADTLDVGTVYLPALRSVQGRVTDPSGLAVPDVSVRATEIGFAARTWTTSTDTMGLFDMQLPDVPMEFVLVPPATRLDVALTRVGAEPGPQGNIALTLASGVTVGGTVLWDDSGRGRPLAGAVVEIRDVDDRLWAVGATDGEGRWSLAVDPER